MRGTFTSKIKDVIHSVFGAELSSINTHSTPSEIQAWKKTSAVGICYNKLFKKIKSDQPATYMSKIVEGLRQEKSSPSKIQIAYAISVSETYLCPDNQYIQMNENVIKHKVIKNLVSFNFNFT